MSLLPPTPQATRPRKPFCLWKRVLRFVLLVCAGMTAFLTGCQSRFIYYPRPYAGAETAKFLKDGGSRLDYQTGEGRQTAWLRPPRSGGPVERLWIVCSGNASRALEMEDICRTLPFPDDAFLLVDYPGYGACEGSPHPSCIRESLRTVIPLAADRLHLSRGEIPARTCVFGFSLGAAAALIAAEEFQIRRAVLCAPFTSTMEMASVVFKAPLGFLVWHRFDNRAGLASLAKNQGRAWIFHGTQDAIIPPGMSRSLAAEFPGTVTLQEVPAAGHNNILGRCLPQLEAAMAEARRS